jgi:hypothetical protein
MKITIELSEKQESAFELQNARSNAGGEIPPLEEYVASALNGFIEGETEKELKAVDENLSKRLAEALLAGKLSTEEKAALEAMASKA